MVDDITLWGSKGLNGSTFAYTRTTPNRVMCVYERDSSFFFSSWLYGSWRFTKRHPLLQHNHLFKVGCQKFHPFLAALIGSE